MNTKLINFIFRNKYTYSNYEICMINLAYVGIIMWIVIFIKLIIEL
jgi:hypothetical protein